MAKTVDVRTLKAMLRDGGELALLDIREEGQFGEGHMLYAVPAPFSVMERGLGAIVPRSSVRIVLVDAGDGVSARAAARLADLGYTDVAVLDGGMPAWTAAGYVVFQGVNVPSKAFGEVVETTQHTPAIPADELAAMQARGENLVVLDGRTPEEFARMSIPGGMSVPNAELVYHIHDIAPDPETTIVVNCAGRTRSIIGAQTLINAGVPNRVVALKGGTMGWRLAGLELNHGRTESFPDLTPAGRERALAYAADVRRRYGIGAIDLETLAAWRRDAGRTLYLLDVRSEAEYAAGHLAGAAHAPGGQLVQGADRWCGVKGARIVLVDNVDGVRATMTAHWLVQMGWDVRVLAGDFADAPTETGMPPVETMGVDGEAIGTVSTAELARQCEHGAVALADVDVSGDYRSGHIPGAVWGVRPRLGRLLAALGGKDDPRPVVLYSEHETRARLAAADMAAMTARPVAILAGGRERWRAEGRPLAQSPGSPPDAERIDFLFWVHDRHLGNDQAALDYLAWEEQLPGQIRADGDAAFRLIV